MCSCTHLCPGPHHCCFHHCCCPCLCVTLPCRVWTCGYFFSQWNHTMLQTETLHCTAYCLLAVLLRSRIACSCSTGVSPPECVYTLPLAGNNGNQCTSSQVGCRQGIHYSCNIVLPQSFAPHGACKNCTSLLLPTLVLSRYLLLRHAEFAGIALPYYPFPHLTSHFLFPATHSTHTLQLDQMSTSSHTPSSLHCSVCVTHACNCLCLSMQAAISFLGHVESTDL